jgi:hypothetical protein
MKIDFELSAACAYVCLVLKECELVRRTRIYVANICRGCLIIKGCALKHSIEEKNHLN